MNDKDKFLAELDALLSKYNATLDVQESCRWGYAADSHIEVNASSTWTSDGERVGTCFEINLGRSHGTFRSS